MAALQELLMQQLLNGQQPDPGEMNRLFAEHADPRVRLIAQFMNAAPIAAASEAEAEDLPDAPAIEVAAPHPAADRRLRRRLRALAAELRAAQTVADTLAAALGACYLCWGEDRGCGHCGGAGRPGWAEPDAALFAEFVAPALQRMQMQSVSGAPAERPPITVPRAGDGQSHRSQP